MTGDEERHVLRRERNMQQFEKLRKRRRPRSTRLTYTTLFRSDFEASHGMTGGSWHHGELSIDQALMMRPFPGSTQYATAVEGLYLCGAGAHPGGGLQGLPGRNAAKEILKRGAL